MSTCETCGQTLPPPPRPCARTTCGHGMSNHALTEKPPRIHKACVVHEGGVRCGCKEYVAVRHDP